MKKFYLVTVWRAVVVEANLQSEAIRRSHELDGPLESANAKDFKTSRLCRFAEPVEAEDLRDAWNKFREGPAAGLL